MSGRISLTQGIDLGSSTGLSSVNLASIPIGATLGQTWEAGGNKYKLVQVDTGTGPVAILAGGAAMYTDKANNIVTMDTTDAQTSNSIAGGFLTATVTDTYYTVIQVGGIQTGVLVDASTGKGDTLSQGTDGVLVSTNPGTACVNVCAAVALTDVSSGTSTVDWKNGNL